jgi:hypothetical protein
MTGELAPSGRSERSAVWVPHVVRRAEHTFRKPVAAAGYRCRRSSSVAALLGLAQATSGRCPEPRYLLPPLHDS